MKNPKALKDAFERYQNRSPVSLLPFLEDVGGYQNSRPSRTRTLCMLWAPNSGYLRPRAFSRRQSLGVSTCWPVGVNWPCKDASWPTFARSAGKAVSGGLRGLVREFGTLWTCEQSNPSNKHELWIIIVHITQLWRSNKLTLGGWYFSTADIPRCAQASWRRMAHCT